MGRLTGFLFLSLASNDTTTIANEYTGLMQRHWQCTKCFGEFLFNLQERMQHEVECDEEKVGHPSTSKIANKTKSDDRISLKKEYFCDVCNKSLTLSSVDILKHKKTHLNDS